MDNSGFSLFKLPDAGWSVQFDPDPCRLQRRQCIPRREGKGRRTPRQVRTNFNSYRAVLYNEVLEVIRTLYKVSREVQEEKRYVRVREIGSLYDPLKENTEEHSLEKSDKFTFKINKNLILNSWIEYRPKTNRHPDNSGSRRNRNNPGSNSISGDSDNSHSKHEIDKQEMATALFEEEKQIVEKFLNKFVANPEISQEKLIDISNVIKALPVKFNSKNVSKSEIINMRNMQLALIGFQNTSQDKLFSYYGTRMKNRIILLSHKEIENREIIEDIKKLSNSILSHVSRMNLNLHSSKKQIPFPNVDSSESEEDKGK